MIKKVLAKLFSGFTAKDIIYVAIIGVGLFFGWRAYQSLKGDFQSAQVAYKQLSDQLARSSNELVTKSELKEFAKSINAQLGLVQKDLKNVGAGLKAIGITVAEIKGKVDTNLSSDDTTPHDPPIQPDTCTFCDIHEYTTAIQHKNLSLGEMPFGRASFDAASDKPWTLQYDDLGVSVKTIVGEIKDDGLLVFYHTISLLNNSRPELKDKEFPLKVVSSEFKQIKKLSKEFFLWAPHIDITFDNLLQFTGDTYTPAASIGFSVMAYGRTKDDNDWRFIRAAGGITAKEKLFLTLEPVQFNLGTLIPLISDLWFGAGGMWNGNWGVTLTLGTTL